MLAHCLAALALAPILAPAQAIPPPKLTFMTFNIRHGAADDGPNSWSHRKGIVVRCIEAYSPGILGLQECLGFQAAYLEEQLEPYRWFGCGREADGGGEMAPILYRHEVWTPLEAGNFWLSETPEVPGSRSWGTACTRMATWGRFRHIETDETVLAINTHFDHVSAQARLEGAKLIVKRAEELAAGAPVVILGDFNARAEESPPHKALTEAGYRDAWTAANDRQGYGVTWGSWDPPDPDGPRIDWILVGKTFAVVRCHTVHYEEGGRFPSDHYPVYAELRLVDDGEIQR